MCVIDGCEVCAYWSFRHRLLHQTNNSYHNYIMKSCYGVAAITKVSIACSQWLLQKQSVMARGGEVRGGSLEVVGKEEEEEANNR